MAEEQNVDFTYGFELRGERQVERGIDSILERFAKTGSVASAASLAVEKFGRIFEVGLPVALGAAAIGIAAEQISEVGEEAEKTRIKIDKLTSEPVGSLDVSEIQSNLSEIGDELEEIGQRDGTTYGTGFWGAFQEGAYKIGYDTLAGLYNNLQALTFYASGVPGKPMDNFETFTGEAAQLSNRAREDLGVTEIRNERQQARLQRKEDVAALAADTDQAKPAGKIAIERARYEEADKNRQESAVQARTAETDYTAFQQSIKDGHQLTKEEIVRGISLEKKLNDTRTKLLNDKIEEDDASGELNATVRDQLRLRRGDVVASHSREIGGGGGIFQGKVLPETGTGASLGNSDYNTSVTHGNIAPNAINPGGLERATGEIESFGKGFRTLQDENILGGQNNRAIRGGGIIHAQAHETSAGAAHATMADPHVNELRHNTTSLDSLTKAVTLLTRSFGLTGQTSV